MILEMAAVLVILYLQKRESCVRQQRLYSVAVRLCK